MTIPLSVDHTRLSALVGAAERGETMTIEFLKNGIKIASGATTATIPGIPEVNPRTWSETNPLFACEIDDLRLAVGRVAHFVAPEKDQRVHITGIALDLDAEGRVTLSATNSFAGAKTALRVAQLPLVGFSKQQAIIPAGPLKEALRALALVGGPVAVELAEGQVAFRTPELSWSLRRLDGIFPDLRAFTPTEDKIDTWVTVEKDRLVRSLKLAGLFASKDDATKQDVVKIEASDLDHTAHVLTISSTASEHGSFEDTLWASMEGNGMAFKVAGPMLRDAAEAVPGERVRIGLVAPDKPFVVVGEQAGADDFQVLTPCV